MKTLRYRIGKEVKPGIVDTQGQVRDASSLVKDWDRENVTIDKLNEVKKADIGSLPIVQSYDSIAPCVSKESIGKFICCLLYTSPSPRDKSSSRMPSSA